MFLRHVLSRSHASLTADTFDAWDAPASELGLDTGTAPVESAEPAAGSAADDPATADGDEPAAAGTDGAEGRDDADDDEQDQDPLDLLTSREDDDQPGQAGRTLEDRFKALSKRSRKLERSLKKSLPVSQALREAGVDLRTLLNRHTTLANMEAAIERNPRLRALFNGEDIDEPAGRREKGGRRQEPAEVKYPFDTNDDVGRFMSEFHQEFRTQQGTLTDRLERIEQALDARVGGLERQTATQQRVSVEREWKTAADAAAGKLDKGVRTMFSDAVHSAMQAVMSGRIRATPQQIIDHYLKDLKVSTTQKQTASAAAKQRIAEGNKQLPRRPEAGRGSPASPQSRRTPRLEEFNRSISRKFGAA